MISVFKSQLEKKRLAKTTSEEMVRRLALNQADYEDELLNFEEAAVLIQETSKEIQQKVHEKISSVVSSCLKAVFDDPYEFDIVFETKAGRTEARIQFVRSEICIDPLSGSGGGVVDVAAFALRVACLSLRRPLLRRVLIFDEPFRFVSSEFRPRVRLLLERLAEDFGIQFIMITHLQELRCGKVIDISKMKE